LNASEPASSDELLGSVLLMLLRNCRKQEAFARQIAQNAFQRLPEMKLHD
jgi:hypothetical protein